MRPYRWARWGDVNAFFGLTLDNLTQLVLLFTLISRGSFSEQLISGSFGFTPDFVLTRMIPGTALGVLFGDLIYTWMAFRLARRAGRADVTAMPLGLDTPSTIAIPLLILMPTLSDEIQRIQAGLAGQATALSAAQHEQAMSFAWHVGLVLVVMVGVFKVLVAPLGNAVRRWVPRAGLLGSLAAIALAMIAFLPLLDDLVAVPVVGLLTLTVILVTLVARRTLPGNFPGALAAVLLGVLVYAALAALNLVPPLKSTGTGSFGQIPSLLPFAPEGAGGWTWWGRVLGTALEKLPIALPFALATIVGGIDCVESAAAVGDEYDTRTILLVEGGSAIVAGLFGGVIQTTPYIGHPAYKAMGGRAAYTLATALFIGAAGFFGWFGVLFEWLPKPALFAIVVFVGLEITAQSYHATPVRHYAALALAALPALACMGAILVKKNFAATGTLGTNATLVSLWCLSNGFIITSLLWGSALAAILDGRLRASAGYLGLAGVLALFGIIHSPFPDERIDLPHLVHQRLAATFDNKVDVLCQSPFHWAAAYALSAGLLVLLSFAPGKPEGVKEQGALSPK